MVDVGYLYDLIVANREVIKVFYGLIIGLICAVIVIKTNRLFQLSLYQGIRYLRNAFFFYGIAFIVRYILGAVYFKDYILLNSYLMEGIFEFFLVMGGFFLLYSLLWKKLEKGGSFSSLFNLRMMIFYIMAFVIVFLDYLWGTYSFMFFSQIILFSYASMISYVNYKEKGRKGKFLKFYFIAMVLSLVAWILNALLVLYLDWHRGVLINVYVINIIIFLLFLYGVVRVTRK